jgi:ribonucleoside-triphosphate reductase (thioredoxin)
MTLPQLQEYTFNTRYARWRADESRRETFAESVDRVVSMHEKKYANLPISDEIAYAKSAMKDRLVLGSQRALQFGGKPIVDKNARLYNCTVSYCDRPRFFQEALWLLLCGCGVGFSVQRHHAAKLPAIARPTGEKVTYQIPDSIEGWADALGVLMSSYFTEDQPFPEYAGKQVRFD